MSAKASSGLVDGPVVRCIPGGGGKMTGDAEARLAGVWIVSGLRNDPALESGSGGGSAKERWPSEDEEPKR